MNFNYKKLHFEQILNIFLITCIVFGIILHISPYFYNRSLWLDEAMLASSICTRNLSNLVTSALDFGQSASVGYLYIVKILTLLFGTSKIVLRITSLITGLLATYFLYLLLKDIVKKQYALLFTSIFTLTSSYIYYSTELKPYMCDNFCCLFTLYLYERYKQNKLSLLKLIIFYSILIWFSFSAVFFIASCMILICFSFILKILKEKEFQNLKKLSCCFIVLLSFILNYILWISKTSNYAGSHGYWNLLKFPLIPTSKSDLKLILKMAKEFLIFFPLYTRYVLIILSANCIFISLYKRECKSHIVVPFILSLILCLIASYLGFYPIQDRLIQSFAIILLVLSAISSEYIENFLLTNRKLFKTILFILFNIILFFCILQNITISYKYLFKEFVYKPNSEISQNIQYLKEHKSNNTMIYLYINSIPTYLYENNFNIEVKNFDNLPYEKNNIILGQNLVQFLYEKPYSYDYTVDYSAIEKDVNLISKYDEVYIFTSHTGLGISELLKALKETGNVSIKNVYYNTFLYKYTKSK